MLTSKSGGFLKGVLVCGQLLGDLSVGEAWGPYSTVLLTSHPRHFTSTQSRLVENSPHIRISIRNPEAYFVLCMRCLNFLVRIPALGYPNFNGTL
jgi:hypothetical protein